MFLAHRCTFQWFDQCVLIPVVSGMYQCYVIKNYAVSVLFIVNFVIAVRLATAGHFTPDKTTSNGHFTPIVFLSFENKYLFQKMARNRKRTSSQASWEVHAMAQAIKAVKLPRNTLKRRGLDKNKAT